jgi:hypothetical protein
MKSPHSKKTFPATARWLCGLLAALALPVTAPAQPSSPQRWLFIFDLSPAMQKRLPATEAVLKDFFTTAAGGQLREGDSIGVWTFDQKLHAGQFPLVDWNKNYATALTTNLIGFLRSQKFTGDSRLAAVPPVLGSVVASSERLTVVIFCAGESEITGTTYDRGINQNFLDGRAERKKNRQPFVVLIRTLAGKYLRCTVNYPPGAINLPPFPVPPPVAPPKPTPVVVAVKPVPVAVPDLVIVGTKVGALASEPPKAAPPVSKPVKAMKIAVVATNPAPASASASAPVMTTNLAATHALKATAAVAAPASNIPPVKAVVPLSNSVASIIVPATNPVVPSAPAKVAPPVAAPATNTSAPATTGAADAPTRRWVQLGIGLLAVVTVLVVMVMIRAGRRPQGSLISRSMEDDPHRK